MNTFKDLELKYRYRSTQKNVYKDFYEKCLERSIFYDRAVGYFTSNSLKLISKGLEKFILNNGKIRITTSVNLSPEDIEAMKAGEEIKIIEKNLIREWKNFSEEIEADTLKIFSWLIGTNKLEIKIAYKSDGIYHEKFGIFQDNDKNIISFSGSVNETLGGMENNFESIEVFNSLDGGKDLSRVEEMQLDFEDLWFNKTDNLKVITLPEALKEEIIKVKVEENEIKKIIDKIEKKEEVPNGFKIPESIDIRSYQTDALDAWFENKCKGILEMATGTGKTITALNIMAEIYKKQNENFLFIILSPSTYLAEQWSEECDNFKLDNVICNSTNKKWQEIANLKLNNFNINNKLGTFALIVSNDTFKGNSKSKKFLHLLKKIKKNKKVMIVIDECHNVGLKSFQETFQENFIENIKFRLGLSATPEREGDDYGNKIIREYLGEVVFKYDLEKAIKNKFLTEYYYYPHYVKLTEDEEFNYYKLTQEIKKYEIIEKKSKEIKEKLKLLYIKRARILNLASVKIEVLIELLEIKTYNNLVYVGAGKREDQEEQNIVEVKKILESKGLKIGKFTSQENTIERESVIKEFIEERINGVVAIKCLDEGINIPSIHRAYILASTTNYREYVQRRGRILRKSPGKKHAEIHDFIVIPREIGVSNSSVEETNLGRSILKREFKRIDEYNSLAKNRYANEFKMLEMRTKYGIIGDDENDRV